MVKMVYFYVMCILTQFQKLGKGKIPKDKHTMKKEMIHLSIKTRAKLIDNISITLSLSLWSCALLLRMGKLSLAMSVL